MKANKVLRNPSGIVKAKQSDDTVVQSDGESKIQKKKLNILSELNLSR